MVASENVTLSGLTLEANADARAGAGSDKKLRRDEHHGHCHHRTSALECEMDHLLMARAGLKPQFSVMDEIRALLKELNDAHNSALSTNNAEHLGRAQGNIEEGEKLKESSNTSSNDHASSANNKSPCQIRSLMDEIRALTQELDKAAAEKNENTMHDTMMCSICSIKKVLSCIFEVEEEGQ